MHDVVEAAQKAAQANGWTLLSDSSWPGYTDLPHRLMQGYLAMVEEVAGQIPAPPTHIFLQAGVGGLAGAVAARSLWCTHFGCEVTWSEDREQYLTLTEEARTQFGYEDCIP